MFLARQGGRDGVHSQNPVVAGLRDPKTPLSARDVIERSRIALHIWGCLGHAYIHSLYYSWLYTLNIGDMLMKVPSQHSANEI